MPPAWGERSLAQALVRLAQQRHHRETRRRFQSSLEHVRQELQYQQDSAICSGNGRNFAGWILLTLGSQRFHGQGQSKLLAQKPADKPAATNFPTIFKASQSDQHFTPFRKNSAAKDKVAEREEILVLQHLPFGSVLSFFSRHSAQLFERSHSMRAWSSSGLMSGFVSPPKSAELSPCGSISLLWRRQLFPETNKPDGYPLCEWQRMVLSETRGLWLSWIVRGGIGFSPETLVLKARSAPEKFG